MKYTIKTLYGTLEKYIQSSILSVIFGAGQGSGASPAVWLSISTVLLSALSTISGRGMVFSSPNGSLASEHFSGAFVDDAQNGLSDSGISLPWTAETKVRNLETMSQTWERLQLRGGALEMSKCFYYVISWQWLNGLPFMLSKEDMHAIKPISLTSGSDPIPVQISQRDVSEAHKTLGVWICPTGDETAQINYIHEISTDIASKVANSHLNKMESLMAYRISWTPAVCYSLGTSTMASEDLLDIQRQATGYFLQKMGVNKNFPRAAAYGPEEYGGMRICHLQTEQGVQQLKYIIEHVFNVTETGKLLLIALQSSQLEAGSSNSSLRTLLLICHILLQAGSPPYEPSCNGIRSL